MCAKQRMNKINTEVAEQEDKTADLPASVKEKMRMNKDNFDWFMINGTCYNDSGKLIGSLHVPTGEKFTACTVKDFVDVISRNGDSNWGRHMYAFEDKHSGWYKKKITKYNVFKFIDDYCDEDNFQKLDGVGYIPGYKEQLIAIVEKNTGKEYKPSK